MKLLTYFRLRTILCRMKKAPTSNDDLLPNRVPNGGKPGDSPSSVAYGSPRVGLFEGSDRCARDWVSLTTVEGRGTRSGIDLDSSASLLDIMEEPEQNP